MNGSSLERKGHDASRVLGPNGVPIDKVDLPRRIRRFNPFTFGLRRLQELGARDAIVFSDRENAASAALYPSVGFGELAVHRQYSKVI